MSQLKIGFIGYGRHAKANLYPSLKTLGVKIQAVATTHEESAKQASEDYAIENYYTDHLEMLSKETLDAVFICAKPEQQLQLVKDALNSNLNVFVEKNLGFSKAEAIEVDNLAKEKGKIVQIGFMKRFAPIYQKLNDVVRDEKFGEILSFSQTFSSRNFVKTGEEYLLFAAIHFIDLLRFYVGEIEVVKGVQSVKGDSLSLSFSLKSAKGANISLYYSASPSWASGAQEITITGTNGYARAYGIDSLKYHFNEDKSEIPGWQTVEEKEIVQSSMLTTGGGGLQNLYLNGFVGEVEYFLNSINDVAHSINNSEENVRTMRLYDMMVGAISE